MATSAFSTSNVKRTLTKAFIEGAGNHVDVRNQTWTRTFRWRYDNAAALIDAPWTGLGNYSTWNKSDTINASSFAALDPQTHTYVAYVAKIAFDPFTPDEIPGYREGCMRKLGFSAASTISEAAAAIKAAAFTDNVVHGTKPLFSTTHERASGTRSNKYSGSWDRTAYITIRNGMQTWTNYQGQIYDLTGAGYGIEFHPDNEEAVVQSVKSRVTSDQLQVNIAADDNVLFIKNPYYEDEDDVIVHTLIPDEQAFGAWERKAPQMYVDTENGGAVDTVTVVMGYAFYAVGVPDGAFGATND